MSTRPVVVSFIGPSGVGKTTVIVALVDLLSTQGLRVGTVKHAPHGFQVDRVGSDSWRHRDAGAERVLLVGGDGAVLFLGAPTDDGSDSDPGSHHRPGPPSDPARMAELLAEHMTSVDVVLFEGFAPASDRVVLVERTGVTPKAGTDPVEVWATVTDHAGGGVGFDELGRLADMIVGELAGR